MKPPRTTYMRTYYRRNRKRLLDKAKSRYRKMIEDKYKNEQQ